MSSSTNMKDANTVGARLKSSRLAKAERDGRRITQAEVAEAVGISRSTLTAYEGGHDIPGRDTMRALANFYDVSSDYLLGDSSPLAANADDIAHDAEERTLLKLWRVIGEEERRSLMILLRAQIVTNNDAA
ncbi:helix-turn-helix domain-containing protein [Acetobacter okinawensis]|uniref:helix-turn-helix domain-containing protein n=1 Tax=Acetobacter okinawensis TaxID=1076594 RepID=UPI00117841D2|nr:helix-turn-helix domain-containing protein [Acetobacter okinawensis]